MSGLARGSVGGVFISSGWWRLALPPDSVWVVEISASRVVGESGCWRFACGQRPFNVLKIRAAHAL
jgi:hypothetical protein